MEGSGSEGAHCNHHATGWVPRDRFYCIIRSPLYYNGQVPLQYWHDKFDLLLDHSNHIHSKFDGTCCNPAFSPPTPGFRINLQPEVLKWPRTDSLHSSDTSTTVYRPSHSNQLAAIEKWPDYTVEYLLVVERWPEVANTHCKNPISTVFPPFPLLPPFPPFPLFLPACLLPRVWSFR